MITINKKEITEDQFKIFVQDSLSKQELAEKLGFTYFNGKVYKKIMLICEELSCSIDHFDPSHKARARAIYKIIEKTCPVCSKLFMTQIGNKEERVTCSHSCSNVMFSESRHTKESNLKRSLTLTKFSKEEAAERKRLRNNKKYEIICCVCGKNHLASAQTVKFCSSSCSMQFSIANGKHKGWASRSKIQPSFPEKVTMEVLNELNIVTEKDYKCGRWFIDFADVDRKIALEIDGKQHNLPERKASDIIKDSYLIENGWTVHRIKWQRLTKEFRNELKQMINDIFA